MSKQFATADEIAWAICLAWRLNTSLHRNEVNKGPEWMVRRSLSTPSGSKAPSSRTAIYAFDALYGLRPNAHREALAEGLGFTSYASASVSQAGARNSSWWDATLARKLRRLLAEKIDRKDARPAPVAEPTQDDAPKEETVPAPRPEPIEARADAFTPRRATCASLGASALHATEIPLRSPFAKRRPLTPAEQARNAALMGDPDPARKAYIEQVRAQEEALHKADLEKWRLKNLASRAAS